MARYYRVIYRKSGKRYEKTVRADRHTEAQKIVEIQTGGIILGSFLVK